MSFFMSYFNTSLCFNGSIAVIITRYLPLSLDDPLPRETPCAHAFYIMLINIIMFCLFHMETYEYGLIYNLAL